MNSTPNTTARRHDMTSTANNTHNINKIAPGGGGGGTGLCRAGLAEPFRAPHFLSFSLFPRLSPPPFSLYFPLFSHAAVRRYPRSSVGNGHNTSLSSCPHSSRSTCAQIPSRRGRSNRGETAVASRPRPGAGALRAGVGLGFRVGLGLGLVLLLFLI